MPRTGSDGRAQTQDFSESAAVAAGRFDFRFEDFLSNLSWLTIIYCVTDQTSILKICPEFQVISSHFFEVDELLDEP